MAKFGPLGLNDFDVFDLPYMFPNIDGPAGAVAHFGATPGPFPGLSGHPFCPVIWRPRSLPTL